MRRYEKELLALTLTNTVLNSALVLAGVRDVVLYVAVAVLEYFLVTSSGSEMRERAEMRYADTILAALFLSAIAYRVAQVLGVIT